MWRFLPPWSMNRSATFVFSIDDRYFGTLTAYVPVAQTSQYGFTAVESLLRSFGGRGKLKLQNGEQICEPGAVMHDCPNTM
jgi:hypothetical protein